jgi:hypothetical protein
LGNGFHSRHIGNHIFSHIYAYNILNIKGI